MFLSDTEQRDALDAPMMSAWPSGDADRSRLRATSFRHGLRGTGLFADAALAGLIDALRVSEGPAAIEVLGPSPDLALAAKTGAAIVTALRTRPVRVRLRDGLMQRAQYADALSHFLAAFTGALNGARPIRPRFSILLSGPGAEAHCHVDPVGVVLLQLRGEKAVWVWPDTPRFLPEPAREEMVLGRPPTLPWRPAMDSEAQTFTLRAGDGLTWPLHAPHRTRSLTGLNVSVSLEYQTDASRLVNATAFVNGVARRLAKADPRPATAVGAGAANFNLLAAATLRRAGAHHLALRLDRADRMARDKALATDNPA
jgi:hypothetical protein